MVEATAIVTSILLAFAIDAWWDAHLERIEERRILASLKAEFLTNAKQIPEFIEIHQRTADRTAELLNAMKEVRPGTTLSYSAAKLMHVLGHPSTDPQRGALDALLQSGELRYISNTAIRERLAAWPRMVVDATENEDLLRNLWAPKVLEALSKNVDLSIIDDVDDACWDDPALEQCAALEVTLPRDTVVMAYLMETRDFAAEAARELGILVKEANVIIDLVDQNLASQ